MRTIRTTMMAVALVAVPGLAFGACAGHQSADADDGVTVATESQAPQTTAPDKTVKPEGQQAMGDTDKTDEKAD